MNDTKQGNPVFAIKILLIMNAITGIASAVVGLATSGSAVAAIGFILALFAILVAFNITSLKVDWWNYAVILNIAGLILYLFAEDIYFLVVGVFLSGLTLLLLLIPSVKQLFK